MKFEFPCFTYFGFRAFQIDNENLPRFLDTANDFKIEGLKQDKEPILQNETYHNHEKVSLVEESKPKENELENDEILYS